MKRQFVIILILFFVLGLVPINFSNATSIATRLKGKILLQVESNGEAWYVNPSDNKRYFLGKPSDAFSLMKELGLGITNSDLEKIRIADANLSGIDEDGDGLSNIIEDSFGTKKTDIDSDGDSFNDKEEILNGYNPGGSNKLNIDDSFASKQAGKILLQVEQNGEAWYVNPSDSKRYFLGRPNDAFSLMRELGLGITNSDLGKIIQFSEQELINLDNDFSVSYRRGRAQPYIVDSQGRGCGINPATYLLERDIPNCKLVFGTDAGYAEITMAQSGDYKIYFRSPYKEDTKIQINYIDEVSVESMDYRIFNNSEIISFSIELNPQTEEPIIIKDIMLAPTGLRVDIIKGNINLTRLSWNEIFDFDYYNIYTGVETEPYLKLIGSTTDIFYNTEYIWCDNKETEKRFFSISAVSNNKESFLSYFEANDDRDHDGLSDEREIEFGSNIDLMDTDGDGLNDMKELHRGTNPTAGDTDGDGYNDYDEVWEGSDPLDKNSMPI